MFGELRRVDGRRYVEDVGGEAALGVEIARDVADGADDREPALRLGDPVHRLVFRDGDVNGEAAADGRERDDGGGQQRTDFHDSSGNWRRWRKLFCANDRGAVLITSLRCR